MVSSNCTIKLRNILIILLLRLFIIYLLNIINTHQMFPVSQTVKVENDSCSQPLPSPMSPQCTHSQVGNSRTYAKTGHWSDQEKLRYLIFIDYHEDKLRVKQHRRLWRVFKAMSAFLKTRRPNQCRNHHTKMESYFEDISAIITYFKHRIPDYQQHYQRALRELQQIPLGFPSNSSLSYKQEESISNNESLGELEIPKGGRKGRGSRTSIRLTEDEGCLDFKDKNLPKTDHSLDNLPCPNLQQQNSRPHLDLRLISSERILHYPLPNTFQLPSSLPLSMDILHHQGDQMSNFFEYYQQRARSVCQLREWIECERLYLLWRNSVQRLQVNL